MASRLLAVDNTPGILVLRGTLSQRFEVWDVGCVLVVVQQALQI